MSYLLPAFMTRQNTKEERISPTPPRDGSGTSQAPVNQQQLCPAEAQCPWDMIVPGRAAAVQRKTEKMALLCNK